MKNRFNVFYVLSILSLLGYFCLIAATIVWIWFGWFYGWRTYLSGVVLIVGAIFLSKYFTLFKPTKTYEREES